MRIALVLAATLAVAGCLDFDGQTIRARIDPERDRIDLLLVYRGIHAVPGPQLFGERDPDGTVEETVAQLATLRDGRRHVALFGNFPFAADFDDAGVDPDRPEITDPLASALSRRVGVRPGPLWRDEQGRLCGAQLVRLTDLADTIAIANRTIAAYLLSDELANDRDWRELDEETRALLLAAAEEGHPFVALRGRALALSAPLRDALLGALARDVVTEVEDDGDVGEADAGQLIADVDWAIERTGDLLSVVIGGPDQQELRVDLAPAGRVEPALTDAVVARGWEIGGPDQEAAAHAAFDAFVEE